MPLTNVKKVVLFIEHATHGWSELYYTTAATAKLAVQGAIGNNALTDSRRAMLAKSYKIRYVRASDVNTQRDAFFHAFEGDQAVGLRDEAPGPGQKPPDEPPDVAINVRLFAGETAWRSFLMRGLAGHCFDTAGNLVNACPTMGRIPGFVQLLAGQYGLLTARSGPPVNFLNTFRTFGKIQQIHVTAAPTPVVGPPAGQNYGIGSVIKVSGTSGQSRLNGLYKIKLAETLALAGPPAGIALQVRPRIAKSYGDAAGSGGVVQLIDYSLSAITDHAIVTDTERKTGRPSYVPAGKAKVRRD